MITDDQTDTVFISDLLGSRYSEVERGLRAVLSDSLKIIPGTKDIWCRDYMPVQLDRDRFIQFSYDPDYLKPKKYQHSRTANAGRLLNLPNCTDSDLVIDGGNVVRCRDAAIMTDKVFLENPGKDPTRLQQQIRGELEIERLILVPTEPGDECGHSDGLCRFVDGNTLLVNDYGTVNREFGKRLYAALNRFELIPISYVPSDAPGSDPGIPAAIGVYINFLQVGNLVVCPTFELAQDNKAIRALEGAFPKSRVVELECCELAEWGGVLNCATWNVELGK